MRYQATFPTTLRKSGILKNLGVHESKMAQLGRVLELAARDWNLRYESAHAFLQPDNRELAEILKPDGLNFREGERWIRSIEQNLGDREPRVILPGSRIPLRNTDRVEVRGGNIIGDLKFTLPEGLGNFDRRRIPYILAFIEDRMSVPSKGAERDRNYTLEGERDVGPSGETVKLRFKLSTDRNPRILSHRSFL
jgi:hypothetical protein